MVEYTLQAPEMSCKSCESMIREKVTALPGVSTVDADATTGEVVVSGDANTRDRAKQAIRDAGYDVAN